MKVTIRKKLAMLTTVLGLGLVVVSVIISTLFYSATLKENVRTSCREASGNMSAVTEENDLDFVEDYREKLWKVYSENREDLEKIAAGSTVFDTLYDREDYFTELTTEIFPPKSGFGMSYDKLVFNNNYKNLLQAIDMVSYTKNLTRGCLWLYDKEHGNIVSMMDTSTETSLMYNYPASIVTISEEQIRNALDKGTETVILKGDECHSLTPVLNKQSEPVAFVYYYLNNAGISKSIRLYVISTSALMLAAMIVFALVIMLFADRLIAKNIRRLSDATEAFTSEIGSEKPVKRSADVRSRDEIGELSERFDLMQDTILGYIDSLAEQTSKEEKMKAELALAARIQNEALPKGRLQVGEIILDSFLKPAREVGGDLYDYFMLDNTHLFFCLADVSGKGIPAALFMMRAKELIKAGVKAGRQLESFVRDVNLELCAGNDECLFITAFFGVLDLDTLHLSYLRAGQEQPFLRRRENITQIGAESNYPLGLFDDVDFMSDEIMLEAGDQLLVFTDGLNEGINETDEGFGYDRIEQVMRTARADTTAALFDALEDFRGSAEQFDDVTMLVLSVSDSLDLNIKKPAFEDIPKVEDAVSEMLEGYDDVRVSETGIIVDELMNNSVSYAFDKTSEPDLSISVKVVANEMKMVFSDNGIPFDPLSVPEKTEEEKEEDTLGGEGISLVRALTASISYERSKGRNILTIRKDMRSSDKE